MEGKSNKLSLIKNSKTREIDSYELHVEFEGEIWSIHVMNFNTYKMTIQRGSTKLVKHFNEVKLMESTNQPLNINNGENNEKKT